MRLGAIVLDCDDADKLAYFYKKLLNWDKEIQTYQREKWAIVKSNQKNDTPLVFQEIENYQRPVWPEVKDKQQQMLHIDFYVTEMEYEGALNHALDCGAVYAEIQYTTMWKVMLDPAGHPFCIIPLPEDQAEFIIE